MSTSWIAEEQVIFVFPDGSRREGRIGIGLPVQREEDAQCPAVLEGLEPTRQIPLDARPYYREASDRTQAVGSTSVH